MTYISHKHKTLVRALDISCLTSLLTNHLYASLMGNDKMKLFPLAQKYICISVCNKVKVKWMHLIFSSLNETIVNIKQFKSFSVLWKWFSLLKISFLLVLKINSLATNVAMVPCWIIADFMWWIR